MPFSVLLGLSGGVDSSAAAVLLKQKGAHVEAAYCIMSDLHIPGIEKAESAAGRLGIRLHVLDLRKQFEEMIIGPFCEEYAIGRTPSPCVRCNPLVKIASLSDKADELSLDMIATGHYADIINGERGYILSTSSDTARDQSYMLYRLTQDQLSRIVFPLDGYTKDRIREIARSAGLENWDSPDSEENCFIPDRNYADYMERRLGSIRSGFFILPDGKRIPHKGVHRYTVGQRKGLGVSYSEPLYVREILPDGDVVLCVSGGEYSDVLVIEDAVINPNYELRAGDEFAVKVRSAAKPVKGVISETGADSFCISFPGRVRAAAPGQSAVLYDGRMLAAGGGITRAIATK